MWAVAPSCAAPAQRSQLELADIFRQYGGEYQRAHRLTGNQRKAVKAIVRCRTPALGGHRDWCPQCGYQRYLYHSCRNRHCPKCQALAKASWLEKRQQELLPVPYFHNVFTMPHELNRIILWSERNGRLLLNLLFQATSRTLLQFGQTEMGGKLGFTMVLHTWDQQLRAHFHVHCLIASGALANDGSRWIAGGSQFLFSVRALSKVFRGKYLEGLSRLLDEEKLDLPPKDDLHHHAQRQAWLKRLRKKPWVIYSKAPFAGPRKLLDYLGRYTHRVALSNHRLLSRDDGQIRFSYRDRRDGDRRKTTTIDAEEFIRRFLQHILPDRFMRVRHYGFLANCAKKKSLARCRELLGVTSQSIPPEPRTVDQWMLLLVHEDISSCPCCGSPLLREELSPVAARDPTWTLHPEPPGVGFFDTS